jgi:2-keto-4-pentenoate hydratase/2-oxohepta-3-ene-1,7-dioic acid hydratase in catechol pathway
MKLLRYGKEGFEKPGMLDADGKIRDLSKIVKQIDWSVISPEGQTRLKKVDINRLPVVNGTPRLGVPYVGITKFVAIGLNYSDHAAESGMPIPKEPIVFLKATSCISGPYDNVMLPKDSVKSDWEVELGVVIGRRARHVSESRALDYVAGYTVVNDVSEREWQLERGGSWDKGKGCDTFGPIGPYLVTADEIQDPQGLEMFLDVNGKRMQTGNTGKMIFGVAKIISYVSQCMTLMPGDIIATGTPPGVGLGMKPPQFLQGGDVMRLGIAKLGEQQQKVVPFGI